MHLKITLKTGENFIIESSSCISKAWKDGSFKEQETIIKYKDKFYIAEDIEKIESFRLDKE